MYLNMRRISSFTILFLLSLSVRAQITVTPTSTAAALATALTGGGVTISSPVLTCNTLANGMFTVTPGTLLGTGTSVFGINSGIVLSSGKVSSIPGVESTLASTNFGGAGDPALTTLAGGTTYDACILEFDIIPTGDTIKFDYIFGSEEYNGYNCSNYNDAFAFFISGPGITGTANMALVPGTNVPVAVNSVNNGVPGTGFPLSNCTSMGAGSPFTTYYVDNTGGTRFTIHGFTTVMTAMHSVIPCNTYHLKLSIADGGNGNWDSDVFLKQGSIVSSTTVSTASVCQGGSTTISASPAGGTWNSANTAIATIDAVTGTAYGVAAGTVDLTYTTGAGCYKITSLTVIPAPVITGPTSVCNGLSVTIGATPTGGTWSGGTTGIATITTAGVVTGLGLGTAPITYTSPIGCVSTGSVTVFNLSPITGPASVCKNSTILLTDPVPGGTWSSGNVAVASVTSTAGSVTGVSAGTAQITYSFGGACYSTAPVNVIDLPAPPAATGASYCQGDDAVALSATGSSLLWYTVPSGGTGTAIAPVPSTGTPGTTTWYVSQTANGCEGPRTPVTATVNPLPVSSISGRPGACVQDTIAFNVTPVLPSATYAWSVPGGLSLNSGQSLSGTSIIVTATGETSQYVHLTVTDATTGCVGFDSLLVTILTPPTVDPWTPEHPCLGDSVTLALSAHSSNVSTYQWWVDGTPMNSSGALTILTHNENTGGPYGIKWNTPGIHIIKVLAYPGVASGCSSFPVYDTVKVQELPDATITFRSFRATPCLYDSVYFAARTYETGDTYEWEPAHSFNNRTGHEAWGILEAKDVDVVLTVTDAFGCKASSTVHFTTETCCQISLPSAFTPNGDGKNDIYRPVFPDQGRTITGSATDTLYSFHRFNSFRIQNRWGQTVFETTNNYEGWDGKFHGIPQDMDVYYYMLIFDCNNKKVVQTGDVTLIR